MSKSWGELSNEGNFENIVNVILRNQKLNKKNITEKPINNKLLTELMKRNNINQLIQKAKNESGFKSNLEKEDIKKILTNYLKKKITPENFREIAEKQAAAKKKANEEAKEKAIQKDTVKKKKKTFKKFRNYYK